MLNKDKYLEIPALKIQQPLGEFYAVKFKAKELLAIAYSEPARAGDELGIIDFTQRIEDTKRLKEIGKYIDTVDSAFPNTIILGANYTQQGEHVTDDELRWKVKEDSKGVSWLIIPKALKLASIIDGQHRLHGFEYSTDSSRLDMELLCSVYIDMPVPYHAYIFSTINFNQRKVDKSLAYNLFGFDLENIPPETWAPETVAIFLSRKLNSDGGPFTNHISLGIQNDDIDVSFKEWSVSMATIVDGILGLITSNPKNDRYELMKKPLGKERKRTILDIKGPPLRFLYLNGYDKALYEILCNYFKAINDVLWNEMHFKSYIRKTVGIQALFEVLKKLMSNFEINKNASYDFFYDYIIKLKDLDFTQMEASGIGKTRIRTSILIKLELIDIESIDNVEDKKFYKEFLGI